MSYPEQSNDPDRDGPRPSGWNDPGPSWPTSFDPMAQPYETQQYPGPGYLSEPYPGQPYAGQQYPGQQYPSQPNPGQAYPGQPYPGYAPPRPTSPCTPT